jgi:hypothetical protein
MSTPTPASEAAPETGVEPEDTDLEETGQEPAEDADPDGAEELGDPGKKALDSMKSKWRGEREKRRELEQRLAELEKPADDQEQPDRESLERQAEAKALARVNERLVKAEVKAAAAGKLADPGDAYRFLDLSQFDVDKDGNVDGEEVADAIDNLLRSKPYLAAQGGPSKPRFQGTADSGARKGNGRPSQLTEADVKRLSAAGKHAEIVKARSEGRLDDYLGLNR